MPISDAAYRHGQNQALIKIGLVRRALGGAALGAIGGHILSPEDRKGQGTLTGALLAGAGAAGVPLVAGTAINPTLAALIGGTAGLGLSQAMIDKKTPDQSEDPYRYYQR